ncbi:MAG TPA: carboxypeptidase-like regulatory domain-containing protein, partial [Planctomycetota bacterium]|nr:carboxypeptidase-like regulatory domain-containing protein [Planctomycetota bacterium]
YSRLLACLFLGFIVSPLAAENDVKPAGETAPPVPPAPAAETKPGTAPAPAVAADPALVEAIESIIDEDEATRKKAFDRLNAATAADLPTLEKYENAADTEIRKQVGLILQRLRRGELAFFLKFPDGTPAAGQKITVKVLEIPAPPKPDENQKQAQAGNNANGNGQGQVQVVINGNVGVGQMVVVGNGVQIVGANGQGMPKEVFSSELTADATGKVVVGRFNDGKYQYQIETQDPLPRVGHNGTLQLQQDAKPVDLEVRHGIGATVTVVDEAGKPLPGALVMNVDARRTQQLKQSGLAVAASWRRWSTSAEADEKGVAKLEKINATELTLVAILKGYDIAGGETLPVKDGESATVTLKLVKATPIACTLSVTGSGRKALGNLRLLFVTADTANTVLGPRWTTEITAKDIPALIEKGAIDAGTTDENGDLQAKLLQDQYYVLGFNKDDGKCWWGSLMGNGMLREKTKLGMQPIQTPQVAQPAVPQAPPQANQAGQ